MLLHKLHDASERIINRENNPIKHPKFPSGKKSLLYIFAATLALSSSPLVFSAHAQEPWQDYEITTEGRTEHGIEQYSNNKFYNNVTIVTSGGQADGIHTGEWQPKITINHLDILTTGWSADGINTTRDAEGTIITINDYAKIQTAGGMGIRAVTSAKDSDRINQIIFNGSSDISTAGAGSTNSGYAVYAGNDIEGCNLLLIITYDCRASSAGKISLLGSGNDLHTISTSGRNAHAVYAYGRGMIELGHVNISTTGDRANGIYAQRRSARYYHDKNTSGNQDYSGTVRLNGNTTVKVTGNGSYAFIADSHDERNGADSEGNHAKIFTDTTNGKSDPIYSITGNMLATKSGIIDLTMGDASSFTGSTAIEKMAS